LVALAVFCLIQGFTEFLPISSQGHLIIFNSIHPIGYYSGITIHEATVIAHFGSLLAITTFYRKTLLSLLFSIKMIDRPDIDKNSFILLNLVISTFPIIIAGYAISKTLDYNGDKILLIIAITSIFFGIVLYIVDKFCLRIKNQNSLNYLMSFLIGIFQCAALIPGVSRSGAILTIMRFFGFQRQFSVQYSNLLSIPVITGAMIFMVVNSSFNSSYDALINFHSLIIFFLSFFFSIIFIYFLVTWVKRFSLLIFAIYRIGFGLWILIALI
jgi:undecaprenyl-diphosphatase